MEKVVIIGGGPAGYTAAIYAARAGLNPLVIEGPQPGGQLMITTDVENYPGFLAVQGPELMMTMRKQAEYNGAKFMTGNVDKVYRPQKRTVNYKTLGPHWNLDVSGHGGPTSAWKKISTKTAIIATGAKAKWLGIDGEQEYMGKGISACATCDGFFFRGKDVIVVGGGDTACEEALYLANICKSVTMIVRKELRASIVMQRRVEAHSKIKIMKGLTPVSFFGGSGGVDTSNGALLKGILVQGTYLGFYQEFYADGVFVAIGHKPATDFLKDVCYLDQDGYIATNGGYHGNPTVLSLPNKRGTMHVLDGLYAAGDCVDRVYRQAVTAAGEGCKAAITAERYLSALEQKGY
jgi:thioredoxin reductase (NADPH)